MRRQKIQMLLMLAVLAVLAAALLGIRQYRVKLESASVPEESGDVIIGAGWEELVKFSYVYEGETYAFEKEEDTWYAAGDHSKNVKQYTIKSMLAGIAPLTAQQTIEDAEDLGQYGLEEAELIICGTDTAEYTLHVGDRNSVTGSYYVSLEGDAKVYVIAQDAVTRCRKGWEDVLEEAEDSADGLDHTNADGPDNTDGADN